MKAVRSARLDYRPLEARDWPFFLALQQDPRVMHFISTVRAEDVIRQQTFEPRLPPWEKGCAHWLCLVIHPRGRDVPMGLTGFIDRGDGIAEVGFLLAPAYQGRGVGSESLRDIVRYAFEVQGFRKLTATVTAGNHASRRTLLNAGFQQEGTLRQNYFLHDRWHDDWIFGLLNPAFS